MLLRPFLPTQNLAFDHVDVELFHPGIKAPEVSHL